MSKELIKKFEKIAKEREYDSFTALLEDKLGYRSKREEGFDVGIKSYDISEISTNLRSRIYRNDITPKNDQPYSDIIKETWPGLSISGRLWRGIPNQSISLVRNEIDFLKYATENGAYTPKYRWDLTVQDGDFERTYTGMSDDGLNSEVVLSQTPEIIFDSLLRIIDKVLATGYIAAYGNSENPTSYRTETADGLEAIWSLDSYFIKSTIYETLDGLLEQKFDSFKDQGYKEWLSRYGYKNIAEILSNHLIKNLTRKHADFPLPLTLHLGNVLMGDKAIPSDYNPANIFELAKGIGDVSGDSIVITDYRRIGRGNEAILEQLLRHPLILENLSRGDLDRLSEHIFIQYRKLRKMRNRRKKVPKKMPKNHQDIDKAAKRLACLNKVNYRLNRSKLEEDPAKLYEVKGNIKQMIVDFVLTGDSLSLKHPEIDQAIRELSPNGSK